jgi:uncharacterized protein (DUF1778 family)
VPTKQEVWTVHEAAVAAEARRSTRKAKVESIHFRVSAEERTILIEASRAEDQTLTDFIREAATRHAEDVLAEQRVFRLPPEQWNAFVAMLDRPVQRKPRLAQFLKEQALSADDAQ